MNDDITENALNAMTQVGFNSFDQGIQNQMQLAGMMDLTSRTPWATCRTSSRAL